MRSPEKRRLRREEYREHRDLKRLLGRHERWTDPTCREMIRWGLHRRTCPDYSCADCRAGMAEVGRQMIETPELTVVMP